MKKIISISLLIIVVTFLIGGGLYKFNERRKIYRLIENLSSGDIATRDDAKKNLLAYGDKIYPHLLKTLEKGRGPAPSARFGGLAPCLPSYLGFAPFTDGCVIEFLIETGKPSVPFLNNLLKDESTLLRCVAIYVLGEIGETSSIPDVIKFLDDKTVLINWEVKIGEGPRREVSVRVCDFALLFLETVINKPSKPWLFDHFHIYEASIMNSSNEEKDKAIKNWQEWWEKNKNSLQANIKVFKNEFSFGEQIKFNLTIRNLSKKPVRLMKPEVFLNTSDPRNTVEFVIVDSGGRNIRRVSHTLTGGMLEMPSVSYSILLKPRETSTTVHAIYPLEPFSDKEFSAWSYDYSIGGRAEFERFLRPGKYKVCLQYYFPEGTKTPRWSDELSRQYGGLWHGEILSNEVEITILKK